MIRLFVLFFIIILSGFNHKLYAQASPAIAWDKGLGGDSNEELTAALQTADGGYLVAGTSSSGISGNKTTPPSGSWIVKLDAQGTKIWEKPLIYNFNTFSSLKKTSDGGFISGGTLTVSSANYRIVKLDANADPLWERAYGGNGSDQLTVVEQTSDGGYILGGFSNSPVSGHKSEPNRGTYTFDYWVIRVDASGNKLWDKTLGGSMEDRLTCLQQTADGGFIVGGYSVSPVSGDKSQPSLSDKDFWVIKLDANGKKVWDKDLGGDVEDHLAALLQTPDGGYLLAGTSNSRISGHKSQSSAGHFDFWIIRLDTNGNKVWDKTFGGIYHEFLTALKPTQNGGYILGGYSNSGANGDKTEPNRGVNENDYWLVAIDSSGNKLWDKTIGGMHEDKLIALQETSDHGFLLGGTLFLDSNGDKTQGKNGPWNTSDYWVLKLNAPCTALSASIKPTCSNGGTKIDVHFSGLQANNSGTLQWTLTYKVNGAVQTATGTTTTFNLAPNAPPGSVYSLVSLVSGTCTVNLNQSFTVQPIPGTPIITSGRNCGTGTVTLSATGAPRGGNYAWFNVPSGGTPLQTDSSGTFTTPILNATTTFFVAATNNAGCEGPRVPVIATITSANVEAGMDEIICMNAGPVQLSGFSPAGGVWSGPGVSPSGIFTPDSSLAGTPTLTYTITQDGCSFTGTKQITVPKPVFLGNDTVACEGAEITLKAQSSSGTFLWSDGSTGSTLKVRQSGSYWLQYKKNGCLSSDTIKVNFKVCPLPFIPNVITPNNDGLNDTFKPKYLPAGKWHLQVFNRWGTRIFEAEDYHNSWPEKKIADGVYYYLIRNPETGQQFKGWVEVIK